MILEVLLLLWPASGTHQPFIVSHVNHFVKPYAWLPCFSRWEGLVDVHCLKKRTSSVLIYILENILQYIFVNAMVPKLFQLEELKWQQSGTPTVKTNWKQKHKAKTILNSGLVTFLMLFTSSFDLKTKLQPVFSEELYQIQDKCFFLVHAQIILEPPTLCSGPPLWEPLLQGAFV